MTAQKKPISPIRATSSNCGIMIACVGTMSVLSTTTKTSPRPRNRSLASA